MKLTAQETVHAPRRAVFDRLADIDGLLAALDLQGHGLSRSDATPGCPAALGAVWQGSVAVSGTTRPVRLQMQGLAPPERIDLQGTTDGLRARATMLLSALAPDRTGLSLSVALEPTGLAGRVLLQSLRLARGPVQTRLGQRLTGLARRLDGG